jgi:hypothetical protein
MSLQSRLGTLARTLRHLKASQILWRGVHVARSQANRRFPGLGSTLVRPDSNARPASLPVFSSLPLDLRQARLWQQGFVEHHGIRVTRNDWRREEKSKLWLYERQYNSELPGLATLSAEDACALVDDWIANNPPCVGVAWDAYPVARRLLNWSLACAVAPGIRSHLAPWLATQMRFLAKHLERHLLGNHLLCDLCALLAASAILEGRDADALAERMAVLLRGELSQQVLADGGYAERTAQYHLIVLQDALLAFVLQQARGRWLDVVPVLNRMLAWAAQLRRPDGSYPWLNDAAPDATPPLETIIGLAGAAGINPPPQGTASDVVIELPDTGWSVIREDGHELLFEHGPVGPEHQPGHGHADSLSFELIWAGVPVICDTGVSTYAVGDTRRFERSSLAHATVTVDGEGADEVWASFRVGGRARTEYLGRSVPWPGSALLRGYAQSYRGWTHHRSLLFWPGRLLLVCDDLQTTLPSSNIISTLPLAPEWAAIPSAMGWSLSSPNLKLQIEVLRGRRRETANRAGWIGCGFGRPRDRASLGLEPDEKRSLIYAVMLPGIRIAREAGRLFVLADEARREIDLTGSEHQ